jgi:glycerophosphoryl diester phosphodiesterase
MTLIIGHRGASLDAPENTLPSFQLAFEQGADGIEADFRLTADGEIVCLHDDATSRTARANVAVAGSALADLRRLDVGAWKGERWRGARIPALREVLGVLPEGCLLFIEVKCGTEIIEPLRAVLAASSVSPERLRILCFSPEVIRAAKEQLPGFRACLLVDYRFRGRWYPSRDEVLASLDQCGADGLASRDRAILDASLVHSLRERSLEIHVWTVDSAKAARRLVALGVDSIMTNRPGWLRQALAAGGEGTVRSL